MEVSIIIVNYKNPPLIVQCVKSILQFEKTIEFEIIVVDNDSQDDTEQQLRVIYPKLKWIQMGYNSGFAKANNAGVRVAEGKYIFYLNSDTIFIEPVFEKMIFEMKADKTVGILTCMLLNKSKEFQFDYNTLSTIRSFKHLLRRNPIVIKFFHTNRTTKNEIRNAESLFSSSSMLLSWGVGAAIFMRKSDILEKNLFWAEEFFMFYEDMYLGYCVRKVGLKCKYIKSPKIIHLGGASTKMSQEIFNIFKNSEITYLEKVYGERIKNLYVYLYKKEIRFESYLEYKKYEKIKDISLQNDVNYVNQVLS